MHFPSTILDNYDYRHIKKQSTGAPGLLLDCPERKKRPALYCGLTSFLLLVAYLEDIELEII